MVTSDLSGAGFALGLDLDAALALAGILALSSVGVVSGVLAGKGLLKEQTGLRVFTTVVIAEALALLLVVATISRFDYGLGAIGGLVLGASLSGLPHRMRDDILPGVRRAADAFFVPLFFAAAGLHLDLSFLALPAATIAALVCIPLAGVTVNSVLDRTRAYPGSEASIESFLAEWTVPQQYDYLVVDDGVPAGIVSLSKARAMRDASRADAPLRDALRRRMPQASPDEPIDDVLQRMAGHWMTVAPVMDPRTGDFLGTVTSHDLLDLVALMDEIEDEVQRQGAGA